MAATVEPEVWTGGSDGDPDKTTESTLKFRTDDDPTSTDLTNPVPIPDSGTNRSYWQHVALAISGDFDEVSNIRFYTDGDIGWDLGTDGKVVRGNRDSGDHGCPEDEYVVASGTEGETGDDIEDDHGYYSGESSPEENVENDTDGDPATIDSDTYDSSGSTKAVVLQADVDTDASSGDKSSETFTFLYDEI